MLVKKTPQWQPEDDDQDFEISSDYYLTGIGDGSPDMENLEPLVPARHGMNSVGVTNCFFDDDEVSAAGWSSDRRIQQLTTTGNWDAFSSNVFRDILPHIAFTLRPRRSQRTFPLGKGTYANESKPIDF